MVHGNTVAYPDSAECYGGAAGHPDTRFDRFQYLVKMDVARDDFIMGMGNADQRSADLLVGIAHGLHQGTMGSPFQSFFH